MQTVIDNVLTNYEVFGKEGGKTILILHGWGQSSQEWVGVASKLPKNYRVILLDLPGFGSSSNPTRPFDTYDYSKFVKQFTKKIATTHFQLIGHSLGGKIGILIASDKNIRVERLFLIAPSGIADRTTLAGIKILLAKTIGPVANLFFRNFTKHIMRLFASEDYKTAGELTETFKKVVGQRVVKEARSVRVPTIIIWGEKDSEIPLTTSKKLNYLIKGSIIRVLWNIGHSPNLELPEKLTGILCEYL